MQMPPRARPCTCYHSRRCHVSVFFVSFALVLRVLSVSPSLSLSLSLPPLKCVLNRIPICLYNKIIGNIYKRAGSILCRSHQLCEQASVCLLLVTWSVSDTSLPPRSHFVYIKKERKLFFAFSLPHTLSRFMFPAKGTIKNWNIRVAMISSGPVDDKTAQSRYFKPIICHPFHVTASIFQPFYTRSLLVWKVMNPAKRNVYNEETAL